MVLDEVGRIAAVCRRDELGGAGGGATVSVSRWLGWRPYCGLPACSARSHLHRRHQLDSPHHRPAKFARGHHPSAAASTLPPAATVPGGGDPVSVQRRRHLDRWPELGGTRSRAHQFAGGRDRREWAVCCHGDERRNFHLDGGWDELERRGFHRSRTCSGVWLMAAGDLWPSAAPRECRAVVIRSADGLSWAAVTLIRRITTRLRRDLRARPVCRRRPDQQFEAGHHAHLV